jgi:hypothetical protein
MSINRELWKVPFRSDSPERWRCPTCKTGYLHLVPDKFTFEETMRSKKARDDNDWDPDWIRYVFAAVFLCSNKKCKEVVTCVGDGSVEVFEDFDNNEYPSVTYQDGFFPKYFSHPLDVFPIPAKCPADIRNEVEKSFQIFMADPGAASNHIRSAIEQLMNYLKVKHFDRKNGKLLELSLHRRILNYGTKKKALADNLLAIKWLGNAGSHPGGITTDDILDAYDIFEHVLQQLFDPTHKDIEVMVKGINRNKGPLPGKSKVRKRK